MKKKVFGRQFKRDSNERKALFKNLLTSLVLHERIRTTEAKAKAIKAKADKLVTKAKKGGDDAYRSLESHMHHEAVVKLINDIAPRFEARQGGYTRIIKTGPRIVDNAAMVFMEWTERTSAAPVSGTKKTVKKKKAEKKKPASTAATARTATSVKAPVKQKQVARKQVTRQKKG